MYSCPHVYIYTPIQVDLYTCLHITMYSRPYEYMYTKSHHQIIRLDDGSKLYKTISIDVGVIYVEIGVRNLCSRIDLSEFVKQYSSVASFAGTIRE